MQVNVVSPFSERYGQISKEYHELMQLDVDIALLGDYHDAFGREESSAYKQLLEDVKIDHLYVVTVGTTGFEDRVQQMADAIEQVFNTGKHRVEKIGGGAHTVGYVLPDGCYWKDWRTNDTHYSEFHVDISSIANIELEDPDWLAVQDIDNLRLAWARSRHFLLQEALVDEVEIRLFETNLDERLSGLQQQLIAYANDLPKSGDRVSYRFPKGLNISRPRGLSRIEEEILSTALIQKLGPKVAGLTARSFAYRFSKSHGDGETEYLYESWFLAYRRFIERARLEASKLTTGAVIRTDIKSFYTRIIQDRLADIATERLTKSRRVEWLIRLLLTKNIDEHEAGLGIVQGNIGSGFFANLYLLGLDSRFASSNEWDAEFFRYVDDMIVVLPATEHVPEALDAIRAELEELELALNEEKTEVMTPSEFVKDAAPDEVLDKLQADYERLSNPLWILNTDLRVIVRKLHSGSNDQWWYQMLVHRLCLQSLGFCYSEGAISRRVSRYLFNPARRNEALKDMSELAWPEAFPDSEAFQILGWDQEFRALNPAWLDEVEQLRDEIRSLFRESIAELAAGGLPRGQERRLLRRLRYSANRLAEIGFGREVALQLGEILRTAPWLLRDTSEIIESLARQGFSDQVKELLAFYETQSDEIAEYMKAITIRSVRFLDAIDSDLWDVITAHAVGSSVVVCLLSTETWLFLGHRCRHLIEERHLDRIELALTSLLPSRLRKNYLLILARYGTLPSESLKTPDDGLFQMAYETVVTKGADELFDYQEPEIIRRTYYSGLQDSGVYEDYPS